MKLTNYWNEFTKTGRIQDYLSYIDQQNNHIVDNRQQMEDLGVNPYAGNYMCNRNSTETGAYRGI